MKAEAYYMGLWKGFYFPVEKRLAHLAAIINPFAIFLASFIPVRKKATIPREGAAILKP